MITIFRPYGLYPAVMAKWSKLFDHDFLIKITVIKWSKLVIFDHEHAQNL